MDILFLAYVYFRQLLLVTFTCISDFGNSGVTSSTKYSRYGATALLLLLIILAVLPPFFFKIIVNTAILIPLLFEKSRTA